MSGALVSFEMVLQKIQRVDTDAATLADTCSLLGLPHRDLFEHRRDQHSHGRLLHWLRCSRHRATVMPCPTAIQEIQQFPHLCYFSWFRQGRSGAHFNAKDDQICSSLAKVVQVDACCQETSLHSFQVKLKLLFLTSGNRIFGTMQRSVVLCH